jgi:hypothetical protein
MKKFKRFLFLFHRWLGVVLCLWFALLFASGIIMMYVEYPELTEEERLQQLEPLDAAALRVSLAEAAARSGSSEFSSIKLSQVLGRPAYQLVSSDGNLHTVFADDGAVLNGVDPQQALAAVVHSGFVTQASSQNPPRYDALVEIDQWTVSSALHASRPLHKVRVNDAQDTVLYVSARSGQIVRDTHSTERFWNWLGSTVHWIYPWQFRQHAALWENVLIYLSLAGVISVFSGAIVGYWRLRVQQRYRGNRVTPYHGFQKWHHLLGLGFLVFLSTWIFSGLMSMLPWGMFNNATNENEQIARYEGGLLSAKAGFPALDLAVLAGAAPIKEVTWRRVGATHYLVLARSATDKRVLLPTVATATDLSRDLHNDLPSDLPRLVQSALSRLQPTAALLEQQVLSSYDSYYYTHHNRYRPLPVLQVRFADAEQCWYYIDLTTGAVVQRLTATDRWARWLYNGLHSFDFALLFQQRPLWDVVVIVLCLCGFAFAVTSVVIGWRRLRGSLGFR